MKIYNNFLSHIDLKIITDYKNLQPISVKKFLQDGNLKAVHRNLSFDIDNTMRDILFPKIKNIFPNFKIDTGSFLESHVPYSLHIDTNKFHAKSGATVIKNKKYNISLLLPLSENFGSKTVFFDYYCEMFNKEQVLNDLKKFPNVEKNFLYTHVPEIDKEIIKKLRIEYIYEWKIGDCIVWPRDQLHMATSYTTSNKKKEAIVIFID